MLQSILVMQARLSSTRLPQKALLPIHNGCSTLYYAMKGVGGVADMDVLACDEASLAFFKPIAQSVNYMVVTGDLNDVLSRYVTVMRRYPSKYIIRATADNLIVGQKLVALALEEAIKFDADYFCYTQTPHGSGVEVMRQEALLQADQEATQAEEREHVSAYLYRHPEKFKIIKPIAPEWAFAPGMRSTMDTMDDYTLLTQFFAEVSISEKDIVREYITWMRERHK